MKNWIIWTSIIALVILVIISVIGGFFGGWSFFAILFYVGLYIGGYSYVRIGMKSRTDENNKMLQRRQKFDWCWERINQILKSMPGGQGVEWASGVGRKSWIKSYFDGIQNKPFRSILAHLERTQQLVLIIFDIDGDDISEFITNPSPELMDNPFLYFKPFARSGGMEQGGLDRFGGYNSNMRYPQHQRGGLNINVNDGGFNSGIEQYEKKIKPDKDTVDKAIENLR